MYKCNDVDLMAVTDGIQRGSDAWWGLELAARCAGQNRGESEAFQLGGRVAHA